MVLKVPPRHGPDHANDSPNAKPFFAAGMISGRPEGFSFDGAVGPGDECRQSYNSEVRLVGQMRYPMPNYPCEFEIPDSWLAEAGMIGFICSAPAYRSTAGAELVRLAEIEPPPRVTTVQKDWRGFDRSRMISVLRGIVEGAQIEPVPLFKPERMSEFVPHPYNYLVRDGFHRFYGSIVARFEYLPCLIR